MMNLILKVEREWAAIDSRRFGVGNISLAGGVRFDHASHLSGLEVDIRPLRKDGRHAAVTYLDDAYDLHATATLINIFHTYASGKLKVFFNDNRIPGVFPLKKHDNHFHAQFI